MNEPQLASHMSGVEDLAADALSRRLEPGSSMPSPTVLRHSTEVHPPDLRTRGGGPSLPDKVTAGVEIGKRRVGLWDTELVDSSMHGLLDT